MPKAYLDHPKGRVLYTLKTFTVKQLDAFRRESIDEIVNGNVRRGLSQMVMLAGLFYAANFATDWIKDWMFGRDPEMDDLMVDNLFKLLGISRYTLYYARDNGPMNAAFHYTAPPAPWMQYPVEDMAGWYKAQAKGEQFGLEDMESTRMIPMVGKFYYWHEGLGKEKVRKRRERNQ
jgi:hypothetical protein